MDVPVVLEGLAGLAALAGNRGRVPKGVDVGVPYAVALVEMRWPDHALARITREPRALR
jgi:hypothetical protein